MLHFLIKECVWLENIQSNYFNKQKCPVNYTTIFYLRINYVITKRYKFFLYLPLYFFLYI